MKAVRNLSIAVTFLGLVGIFIGAAFLGFGLARNAELAEAMRVEDVNLGIGGVDTSEVIDTLGEAKEAGDTVREHRHGIAATYEDLLGEGRFDPANPEHLTYAQALNLENYLYLAVAAFGLIQAVMGAGVFMILAGVGLGSTGVALYRLTRQVQS